MPSHCEEQWVGKLQHSAEPMVQLRHSVRDRLSHLQGETHFSVVQPTITWITLILGKKSESHDYGRRFQNYVYIYD